MTNKHFAVIGHPIIHSMSPFIHKRLFELAGTKADYKAINIPTEQLTNSICDLKKLDGFNITIPHKQDIIPFLDNLSPKARLCQSVNTVKISDDGKTKGYTTDTLGFLKALEAENIELKGKVVIIGAGGAACAIANEVSLAGCETILAVRYSDLIQASRLAGNIISSPPIRQVSTCTINNIPQNIDLLINATPVGMYPDVDIMPVKEEILLNCKTVFDAVYNPFETLLVKTAKRMGIKAFGGMSMLVWQAVASQEIWNNSVYNIDDINQLCEDTYKEMKNKF